MKTLINLSIVLIVNTPVFSQVKNNANIPAPKHGTYVSHAPSQPNNSNNQNTPQANTNNGNNGSNGSANWGGQVTLGFNNYPNNYPNNYQSYGYANYNSNYNSYGNMKRSAKYATRAALGSINQALDVANWHNDYQPLLAKAIRHYDYARQLYYWGNYQSAINHAERARYLSWYVMQYYQNSYYNNGTPPIGFYEPNPYSDPYNPYYKKSSPNDNNANNGFKQNNENSTEKNVDLNLPQNTQSDTDLIKSFNKTAVLED